MMRPNDLILRQQCRSRGRLPSGQSTALWVILYGPAQLGRVRAATTVGVVAVVARGASPGAMGLLVDHGVSLSAQAGSCAVYILLASLVATRT